MWAGHNRHSMTVSIISFFSCCHHIVTIWSIGWLFSNRSMVLSIKLSNICAHYNTYTSLQSGHRTNLQMNVKESCRHKHMNMYKNVFKIQLLVYLRPAKSQVMGWGTVICILTIQMTLILRVKETLLHRVKGTLPKI